MALRSVEIFLHPDDHDAAIQLLKKNNIDEWWEECYETHFTIHFVLTAELIEKLSDEFESRFGKSRKFRLIITSVEATLPRLEEKKEEKPEKKEQTAEPLMRISREELYADITDSVAASRNFVLLMILSSVVAGIGILENNIAIVIGAMVIAPLLGPNVSLAFATTLGDLDLIRKSIITALIGTVLALGVAVVWGMLDPSVENIKADNTLKYSNIVLAFVSGVAAVLSMLRGLSSSFVGVMVAVALLPPLIKTGLLLGGGHWMNALYAWLIFFANIICLNLAGIFTFLVAGIRPNKWWEEKIARRHTTRAIIAWSILLIILVLIIYYLNHLDLVKGYF